MRTPHTPDDVAIEVPSGLDGVVVADTAVGDVRGREGFFHYHEYSAVDLARDRSFEDVWHLLLRGELPGSAAERDAFAKEAASLRSLPDDVLALVPAVAATTTTPLDGVRTVLGLVTSAGGFRPVHDLTPAEVADDALRVTAVLPTIVAALHRARRGLDPVAPREDLPHVANLLAMLTGGEPAGDHARALERYLITTVDHGFNASTFTARVIASTGADVGAAVIGAIGALSGPLHGGAPSRALDLLDEIGDPARAPEVVRAKVTAGERIMGFGHRVYRTRDPRAAFLREVALEVGGDLAAFAAEVEDLVVATLAELKPGRQLYANVEYYAGIVLQAAGLPPELFTPAFATSRAVGWCAHILEQHAEGRIIRPSARYVGRPAPQPLPPVG